MLKKNDTTYNVMPNKLESQNSLYNLTMDEAQNHIPLNAMNLDELVVKNVIPTQEGHQQLMQNQSSSSSSSSSSPPIFHGNLTLLCKRTVDEVWKEIVQQEQQHVSANQAENQEATLEDMLVRASVMNGGSHQDNIVISPQPLMAVDPMALVKQQAEWLQFQQQQMTTMPMQAVGESNFQVSDMGFDNPTVLDVGYTDNQLPLPMPGATAASSDSQGSAERKRKFTDEMMEKTIERRQRRMIKNRESAARSRARKQAYTNRLEHELLELRKTNNTLKKQKEVEKLLCSKETSNPRYQLRRTSSASL